MAYTTKTREDEGARDEREYPQGPGGGRGGAGWLVAALALLATGLLVWAIWATVDDGGETAGPDVGVTLGDITANPAEFVGSRVTVSGEVNDVVADSAFTIGGDDFADGEELLVVAVDVPIEREGDEELSEEDVVQVTGTVRMFSLAATDDDLGVRLDPETFAEFEGEPVIVADTVVRSDRIPPGAEAREDVAPGFEEIAATDELERRLAALLS